MLGCMGTWYRKRQRRILGPAIQVQNRNAVHFRHVESRLESLSHLMEERELAFPASLMDATYINFETESIHNHPSHHLNGQLRIVAEWVVYNKTSLMWA